jgi:hypothetical protein
VGNDLTKAMSFLVSPLLGRNFQETMNKIDNFDYYKNADKVINLTREEMKKQFKTSNIVLLFSENTVNCFDIYLDTLRVSDVLPNPLEFSFSNGYFTLKDIGQVQISVIINPKMLKQLVATLSTNYTQAEKNIYVGITDIGKELVKYFTYSLFGSLIQESYREGRTAQFTVMLNVIKEMANRGISNNIFVASWKERESSVSKLYLLFKDVWSKFQMNYSEKTDVFRSECFLHPHFSDLVHFFGSELSISSNPLFLYKMFSEMTNSEIYSHLNRYNIKNFGKGIGKLVNIMSSYPKDNNFAYIYKATLSISRIVPYILYSTYFIAEGNTFSITSRIITAIRNALPVARSIGGGNVNQQSIKNLVTKIETYISEYYKLLNNPQFCNKQVIETIKEAVNIAKSRADMIISEGDINE